jgi:putative addiction module killer protein
MIEIRETEAYSAWFGSLRDGATRARINIRIRRLSLGNPGNARSVGGGVMELKIDFGPGWRVYYTDHGSELVFLLGGGNKASQSADIEAAKKLANDLKGLK